MVKPGVARFGEKNGLQGREQSIAVLGAGLTCGKARVVGEMGKLWGSTETRPPVVRMGINGNITVLRVEDGIGLGGLPVAATALAGEDTRVQIDGSFHRLCSDHGIQERHRDFLADAVLLARLQGHHDGINGRQRQSCP